MEEYGEIGELRRMKGGQERERRRIRDRERRQSMTQEQRERHLARRRRNYQLRRQRAVKNNMTCSILDYTVVQTESGQESSHYIDGSEVHKETQTYKPTNLPRRLRLNHIRQLARNMMHPIVVDHDSQIRIHQIVPHVIPNGDLSSQDNIRKSLRLNRMKQLARSLYSPSKEISAESKNDRVQQATNITP